MLRMQRAFKALIFLVVMLTAVVNAQDYQVLWEDHFEDDDPLALKDVGWIYYGENLGFVGQTIKQEDGKLFVEAGSYAGLLGAALVETNGVPEIDYEDEAKTKSLLVANNYSDPNQIITFKINFQRFTTSAFIMASRLVQIDTSSAFPDADPTVSPGYVLFISPLEKVVRLGRYDAELAITDPTGWTYFGEGNYDFELGVFYWIQYYLIGGDFKVRIWEGELSDESSTEWLVEGVDPEPRVTGKFTLLGILSTVPFQPGEGDNILVDDFIFSSPGATSVDASAISAPSTFMLEQNFPNPFNPTTTISFSLSKKNPTRLSIYNSMGQHVRTLVDENLNVGYYHVTWDGNDDANNPVAGGLYFYKLSSGNYSDFKKLVLVK